MHSNRQHRFATLIEAHRGILYKVAHAYCRTSADRAELVQEILVQLWRAFPRFDEQQRFSTWSYRLAMNVAISSHRRERRRSRDLVPLTDIFEASTATTPPAGDHAVELFEVLHRLDELERALVLLHLDGHSHEEIAAVMGWSPSNVSTRLHRIRKQLQSETET